MEEKLLKLTAELGFLALVIWILSAAFAKNVAAPSKPACQWKGKGDRWSNTPVVGPDAQSASFFPAPLAPLTRYY
jgi:hypothetical protein